MGRTRVKALRERATSPALRHTAHVILYFQRRREAAPSVKDEIARLIEEVAPAFR
jgi:hypothetical protein